MSSISGVPITTDSIIKCYEKYYPDSYNQIANERLFHYLHLFGIRVATYDTSLRDDFLGGLRISNLGINEIVVSEGSTDPSPKWLLKPFSTNAQKLGGTPFVKEGQYSYKYYGKKHGSYAPYAAFCPIKPVKVYRWTPTADEKKLIESEELPTASLFEKAVREGRAKSSTSPDTCIHRSWNTQLWGDSAGCQLVSNLEKLNKIGDFASDHISKGYGNVFIYTVFSKEQFLNANGGAKPVDIASEAVDIIINSGNSSAKARTRLESFDSDFLITWANSIRNGGEEFLYKNKKYYVQGGMSVR